MSQSSDTVWLPVLPSMRGFGPALVKQGGAQAAASGKTLGRTLGKGLILGMAAGGAAVAGFAAYGLKEFGKFESGMNEVFSLMPGISDKAMSKMNDDVRSFVREMGIAHDDAVPALYQAISAGIPQDNVFEFMEVAAQASIGGVTDLETAVDGITSVMNAYGHENISASEASDLMFTAVKNGKTTFDELSGSLYNVLPTASALGVDFGDVTAAMASMTAQGTPTSVATTQLRQMMVELSKDGGDVAEVFEKVSGQSFKDFVAEGGNTADALALLHEHAEDTGVGVNDLFGSVEAGNAALALSGDNAAAYVENIDDMADSAGATEAAYDQMDQGIERTMERIGILFKDAAIEVGENLAPTMQRFADFMQDNLPTIIEKVTGFFEGLATGIAVVYDFVNDHLIPALKDFAGYVTDTVVPALQDLWDRAKDVGGYIKDGLVSAFETVHSFLTEDFVPAVSRLWEALKDLGEYISGGLLPSLEDMQDAAGGIVPILDKLWGAAQKAWDIFKGVAGFLSGAFVGALNTASGFLEENKGLIKGVATVITIILLPALARLAFAALITMGQVVASWIGMASAAIISGAQTAAIWLMYRMDAIRAAGVYVVQSLRIVGAWALMAARAVASGITMAAVWTAQIIRSAVVGAASFIVSAARVVGGWVLMSVQSLLHAGRMAAAWFIALGPVGWIIGAIIGLAAIVILNWEKIKDWTVRIWNAVVDWVVKAWEWIRDKTRAIVAAVVTWVVDKFNAFRDRVRDIFERIRNWIVDTWTRTRDRMREIVAAVVSWVQTRFTRFRDRVKEIFEGVKTRVTSAWESVRDMFVSVWEDGIKKPLSAFGDFFTDTIPGWIDSGVDMIKKAWRKVQKFFAKPINWVINKVWNDGIGAAFNTVADKLNLPDKLRLPEIKEIKIPEYAKGGIMGSGLKVVGEEGPEVIATGPGWVGTARETQKLLQGRDDDFSPEQSRVLAGSRPSEAMLPMGGWWSDRWDDVTGWVRGGFANMASSVIDPLADEAKELIAGNGLMSDLAGGLIDWGVEKVMNWIRGNDSVETGEYGGNFQGNPGGFNRPMAGPVTSWYGPRWGRLHAGVDIGAPIGSAIRAAYDGVVSRIYGSGLDQRMVLDHGKFATSYLHNSEILAGLGDQVKGGQRIARSGTAGTGPHLHFEKHVPSWYNPVNSNYLFGGGGPGMFLRDKGGPIYPGLNAVLNNTGKIERTFNDPQFDNLNKMAARVATGDAGGGFTLVQHGMDPNSARENVNEFARLHRRMSRGGKYPAGVN